MTDDTVVKVLSRFCLHYKVKYPQCVTSLHDASAIDRIYNYIVTNSKNNLSCLTVLSEEFETRAITNQS